MFNKVWSLSSKSRTSTTQHHKAGLTDCTREKEKVFHVASFKIEQSSTDNWISDVINSASINWNWKKKLSAGLWAPFTHSTAPHSTRGTERVNYFSIKLYWNVNFVPGRFSDFHFLRNLNTKLIMNTTIGISYRTSPHEIRWNWINHIAMIKASFWRIPGIFVTFRSLVNNHVLTLK